MSDSVIFNELLFYAAHHMHRANSENIKKCICTFYTDAEIVDAKRILWDKQDDVLGRFRERNNSDNRAASSQHVADILLALRKLDESSILPRVAALHYDRLPRVEPEECNVAFMAQRLLKLENIVEKYEEMLAELRMDLSHMQSNVGAPSLASHGVHPEKAKLIGRKNMKQKGRARTVSDSVLQMPTSSENSELLNHHQQQQREGMKGRSHQEQKQDNSAQSRKEAGQRRVRGNLSSTTINTYAQKASSDPFDAGEGFRYPRQFVKRQRSRKAWGVGTRENVPGEDSGVLRGAPTPSRYVFVYRVQEGNSDSIKNYCIGQGVQVRQVTLRSNAQAKYKSFVLELSVDDHKKVLNGEFWPGGIHVRPYKGDFSQQASSIHNE